jgi:chloramphenicol 3-O-phosphotransferase
LRHRRRHVAPGSDHHAARAYDLEIDTSATTPAQNAAMIRDAFGL